MHQAAPRRVFPAAPRRAPSAAPRRALGLSQQMMLLAVIVCLPLLILHGVHTVGERQNLVTGAGVRARTLVEMATQLHADALRDDRTLLRLLARMPEVAGYQNTAACRSFLVDVTRRNPQLAALTVLAADGTMACASSAAAPEDDLAALPWVRAALAPGSAGASADGVALDPRTGHSMIGLAQGIGLPGTGLPLIGVLVARVDLAAVWSMVARAAAADRMAIMLLDGPDQRVIAVSSPETMAGPSFPRRDGINAAIASGAPRQVMGRDGSTQMIAAAALPGPGQQVLLAGIATDRLLADAHRRSLVTLVGMMAAAVCVLAAVWLLARWSLLRPLGVVVDAARRFRGGDLTVRVTPGHLWAPEFAELAAALNIAARRMERSHQLLSDRANRDGLTGLASRRCFDAQLLTEWRRARRSGNPLAVLMIDVDEFKTYNDRYGHVMGDECLRQIAAALQACLRRPSDMAARYGGEEIVILLPETDLTGAAFVASRMLAAVRDLGIVHRARPDGLMTVSIGVASASPGDADEPAASLLKVADAALYAAKRQGRARFVTAGEPVMMQ